MIGVICSSGEREPASEFFELFKTPWEFRSAEGSYHTVICTTGESPAAGRNLTVHFAPDVRPADSPVLVSPSGGNGMPFPVYHPAAPLPPGSGHPLLLADDGARIMAVAETSGSATVIRAAFNPFRELDHLLRTGQPEGFAAYPALDALIDCLRNWITGCGVPLVEIPPVPAGHPFSVCLTHDVDHPSLRRHRLDHTMWGYLLRSTAGSAMEVARGRRGLSYLTRNLKAAASLPMVHLGWKRDSWRSFTDYVGLDAPATPTFFVIPRSGDPGRGNGKPASPHRASGYGAHDIREELEELATGGAEIAVHGIDAWADAASGRHERDTLNAIPAAAARNRGGIRMHWLYADRDTPARLEEAGYRYDSTFGYCSTVGYRAGTTQPYRPPGTKRLRELPLHVMDTALFYPAYLHLRQEEAAARVRPLIDHAESAGGVLTLNWHDRSLFPERQWADSYRDLLRELRRRNPWMPSASQAVDWFDSRRAATFETSIESGETRIRVRTAEPPAGPPLRLRIHRPETATPLPSRRSGGAPFTDLAFTHEVETSLPKYES